MSAKDKNSDFSGPMSKMLHSGVNFLSENFFESCVATNPFFFYSDLEPYKGRDKPTIG